MIGNSRDGTYSKKGTYQGQGAYFFPETAECAKQSFDASLKRIKKTGKQTCCHGILPH